MRNSLKWMFLGLTAVALICGYWYIVSGSVEANSPILAARYHARNRTASFFQRAGKQGQRSGQFGTRT